MNEIKEFWEQCHHNDEKLWLAGSHLQEVLQALEIKAIKVNGNVLVIGVGLGYEVKELREITANIDVLDISEFALARVKGMTKNQYLASEIEKLPENKYDLIMSYLVTQHIDDEELNRHLKYGIRALTCNGIFAMQFAFLDNDFRGGKIFELKSQKEGTVFRSYAKILFHIALNEGNVKYVSPIRIFDHTNIKHQFIHIERL
jgi:predicted TPR repeat methyltransferase